MRKLLSAILLAALPLLPLAGCKEDEAASPPPPPRVITADAMGHYCGMNMLDHPGPKGQIVLKGRERPVWLSSVRDTFAYTMLPEESHDYRAIYVTDLAAAPDPAHPDLAQWTEARDAWFVIDSGVIGGMGAAEPLPFGTEAAARAFAAKHGGIVKRFSEVTDDYILAPPPDSESSSNTWEHDTDTRSTP